MEKLFLSLKNKLKKHKKIVKKLSNIVLLIISFAILIYFCIENNNWDKMIGSVPRLNLTWILLAVFAILLSWYFDSLTIFGIINFMGNINVKKIKIYKVTILGQYFTSITPMGIGSPPAQTSELIKMNVEKNNASIIIGTKFMIYQISLIAYSLSCATLYCIFFRLKNQIILIYLLIGLGFQSFMVLFVLIFLANKKFFIKIENVFRRIPIVVKYKKILRKTKCSINLFADALKSIWRKKWLITKLFFYSFIQISLIFLVPFFIFKAFHHSNSPALEIVQTQCVVNTACAFTPLPGNTGTSEKIFLDLFSNFFLENEIIIAMILHRIITFYFNIIVGATVYFWSKKREKTSQQNQ